MHAHISTHRTFLISICALTQTRAHTEGTRSSSHAQSTPKNSFDAHIATHMFTHTQSFGSERVSCCGTAVLQPSLLHAVTDGGMRLCIFVRVFVRVLSMNSYFVWVWVCVRLCHQQVQPVWRCRTLVKVLFFVSRTTPGGVFMEQGPPGVSADEQRWG